MAPAAAGPPPFARALAATAAEAQSASAAASLPAAPSAPLSLTTSCESAAGAAHAASAASLTGRVRDAATSRETAAEDSVAEKRSVCRWRGAARTICSTSSRKPMSRRRSASSRTRAWRSSRPKVGELRRWSTSRP